jgi:glycine/D-amino acid oxidase-like deaminating enzyme
VITDGLRPPYSALVQRLARRLATREADGGRPLWLRELDGEADLPPLEGRTRADVCIVGGGYVGLWTAIWLKRWDPGCDVVIVERDVCGSGASGRNGGFALSWWGKFPSLAAIVGPQDAASLCRQSAEAIDELERFAGQRGFDPHVVRGGWLWTARTQAELGAWEHAVGAVEKVAAGVFERLAPAEVARRSGSSSHLAGVLEPAGATVQPWCLVRGLRRAALDDGVRIYEHTRARRLGRQRPPSIETATGRVEAETVVLATNAWAAGVRELHLRLFVISSDIVATAPIPERLAEIGWTGGECITDSQLMVDYYRTTRDGRIVFGKGGWGIALAGRIPPSFERNARRARTVAADLHHAYPMLRDARIELDWSGPIDRSPDGIPLLGQLGGRRHILYGVGWSGNGVAPSLLGGKVLAAKALGRDDDFGRFPLWNRRTRPLPPEPIRYLGAHVVRAAVKRKERAERQGRRPSRVYTSLARLVPAGLEDH